MEKMKQTWDSSKIVLNIGNTQVLRLQYEKGN